MKKIILSNIGFCLLFLKIGTKKAVKSVNIDEENSQDFVKISSPLSLAKKRLLTEHQKEKMRQMARQ